MSSMYLAEVYKRSDGKFDLRVLHTNGNFLFGTQQGYENEADCRTMFENFVAACCMGHVALKPKSEVSEK